MDNINKTKKQNYRKRQESGKQSHRFLEDLPDALVEVDFKAERLTYMNSMARALFGYTKKEVASGIEISRLFGKSEYERAVNIINNYVTNSRKLKLEYEPLSEQRLYEFLMCRKDGSLLFVETQTSFVPDEDGIPIGLQTIIRDITKRKRTELLIAGQNRVLELLATGRALEEILTALIDVIEEQTQEMLGSVLILDENGKLLRHGAAPSLPPEYNLAIDGIQIGPSVGSCGTAAYKRECVIVRDIATDPLWEGYQELALKHNLRACWSQPIFSSDQRILGTFAMYYRQARGPSPEELQLIQGAAHLAGIAIERTRLQEEEVGRAQRLEAAGRVAGQIAHDFNNLLSPLAAYPTLIREELPTDHSTLNMLNEMEFAANKMSVINQQLLALGRRGHYSMDAIDLNDLLEKVVLSQSLPEDTVIHKEFATSLLLIKGGEAQLTRVVINLITNAIEAMQGIGVLTLRTENIYLERPLKRYQTVKRGEYVKLHISDTGSGIEPDVIDNIFDPFVTTKKMDHMRGSGLGLSVVHGIVGDHKGYVTVESNPGQGSVFSVYFPTDRTLEITEITETTEGGNEKILVIDDDPVQRKVACHLLKRLGYLVRSVSSGEQAVRCVQKHPQDLLLIDMVMDGMDGTETYQRVLEFQPEQKAIILSGYAISQRVEEALKLGAGTFVSKPVTLSSLALEVRTELDREKTNVFSEMKLMANE